MNIKTYHTDENSANITVSNDEKSLLNKVSGLLEERGFKIQTD